MDWHATWDDPCTSYLSQFDRFLGDARTRITFAETLKGIIAAGLLVCQRIAACSPILATAQDGAHRVWRFARGESTKRSPMLDAAHLTASRRTHAVERPGSVPADERWLVADGSEVRKPHARTMPHRIRVRGLDGSLVNGYRILNLLGITPKRRGVHYHRLFSIQCTRLRQ